ncbi:hypothetical protein Tco_0141688 [Tanacetum coccineum]
MSVVAAAAAAVGGGAEMHGGDKGEGGGCGVVKVAVVWRGGREGWCSWRSTGDRRKLAGYGKEAPEI